MIKVLYFNSTLTYWAINRLSNKLTSNVDISYKKIRYYIIIIEIYTINNALQIMFIKICVQKLKIEYINLCL